MKHLKFGNGDKLPALGLGTWKSKPGDVYGAVIAAIKLGYRHIDCAAVYGNEAEIGEALTEAMSQGLIRRDELWVTSKLWCDSFAIEDVEPALQKTLADLQLDYLDLYLLHWPIPLKKGGRMGVADDYVNPLEQPVSSTWQVLEQLRVKGLTRHIGVSNFSKAKLQSLIENATLKPEVNQIELHPYLQQADLRAYCREQSIHLTCYSPLGSQDRPSALKAQDEPVLLNDPVIKKIANHHEKSPAQVILSWALSQGLSTIPKSVSGVRLEENLEAAEFELSVEELTQIERLDRHRRYITGEFWLVDGGYYSLASIWDE